jgi:hypothetical protein
MNKQLTLALAATAIAAASSTFISTTAEAGGRGGHRFHFRLHQFHMQQHAYRSEESYVVRRKKPKVVVKQVVKYVEKPAAAAKLSDAQGRQFDPTSKVWFDGKGQCWSGDKSFSFKSGSWFYGDARWVETTSGWGVSTGGLPQQVTCDGIKAFSSKIEQAEAKPAKTVAEPKVEKSEPKAEKVEQAELKSEPVQKPVARVVTSSTDTPAKASDCKKYFPSVGEMVSVPCTE